MTPARAAARDDKTRLMTYMISLVRADLIPEEQK